ncbi:hypothetical protein DVH24_017179 [Malus domestica]|uniref:Transmembrane protein n=1 Tax=Malus domestica TaxID=3750 RepID=A0A498IS15_MALDO|nr:hypothetical protein DVH24_017179 [Malus domestica]
MKLVDEEPYEINVDIYGIRDGPRLGRLRLQNKLESFVSVVRYLIWVYVFCRAWWLWRRKIRIDDRALAMNYQLCLSLSNYELNTKLCVDMENEARNYYTNGGKKKSSSVDFHLLGCLDCKRNPWLLEEGMFQIYLFSLSNVLRGVLVMQKVVYIYFLLLINFLLVLSDNNSFIYSY